MAHRCRLHAVDGKTHDFELPGDHDIPRLLGRTFDMQSGLEVVTPTDSVVNIAMLWFRVKCPPGEDPTVVHYGTSFENYERYEEAHQ